MYDAPTQQTEQHKYQKEIFKEKSWISDSDIQGGSFESTSGNWLFVVSLL